MLFVDFVVLLFVDVAGLSLIVLSMVSFGGLRLQVVYLLVCGVLVVSLLAGCYFLVCFSVLLGRLVSSVYVSVSGVFGFPIGGLFGWVILSFVLVLGLVVVVCYVVAVFGGGLVFVRLFVVGGLVCLLDWFVVLLWIICYYCLLGGLVVRIVVACCGFGVRLVGCDCC